MSNLTQLRICAEKILPEQKNTLNELRIQSGDNKHRYSKLKAAFYTSKLWDVGETIKIKFLEPPPSKLERTVTGRIENLKDENGTLLKIDPLQKVVDKMDIINAIMKIVTEHIQPFVGVNLIFVGPKESADIRISFDPNGGAWSLIGTDCKQIPRDQPTMNFGWFDVATTIHEFGHALGMIHEHQNPKGNKIEWDKKKVYEWAEETQGWDQNTTYSNIIEKYDANQINGSDFDPMSIMLYFFPGDLTTNNKGTHQNLRLSAYDVEYLNSVYPTNNKNKCGVVSCETPSTFYNKVYNENINNNTTQTQIENPQIENPQIGLPQNILTNSINNILNDTFLKIILIIFSIGLLIIFVKDYIMSRNNKK